MSKGAYAGVGSAARKIKKAYVGVGGVARKVKKAYIGVGGVARLCWSGAGVNKSNSSLYFDTSSGLFTELSFDGGSFTANLLDLPAKTAADYQFRGACYFNDTIWLVNANRIYYLPEFSSAGAWNELNASQIFGDELLYFSNIVVFGDKLVVTGYTSVSPNYRYCIAYSTDGLTWTVAYKKIVSAQIVNDAFAMVDKAANKLYFIYSLSSDKVHYAAVFDINMNLTYEKMSMNNIGTSYDPSRTIMAIDNNVLYRGTGNENSYGFYHKINGSTLGSSSASVSIGGYYNDTDVKKHLYDVMPGKRVYVPTRRSAKVATTPTGDVYLYNTVISCLYYDGATYTLYFAEETSGASSTGDSAYIMPSAYCDGEKYVYVTYYDTKVNSQGVTAFGYDSTFSKGVKYPKAVGKKLNR